MTRDEKIKMVIDLARSFSKTRSRGSPALEEELFSLLCEVGLLTIKKRGLDNFEAYLKTTFNYRCLGYFDDMNEQRKKDRAVKPVHANCVYNDGITNILMDDLYESNEFTWQEKALIVLRLKGQSDEYIITSLDISKNRFKAVIIRLERKVREFLI